MFNALSIRGTVHTGFSRTEKPTRKGALGG